MSLTHVSEIVPRSNILGAPDQSLPSEPLFARYLNTPSPPTVHLPAETRFRHRRITSSQSAAEPRPRGPCAYRDSRHHKHIKKVAVSRFLALASHSPTQYVTPYRLLQNLRKRVAVPINTPYITNLQRTRHTSRTMATLSAGRKHKVTIVGSGNWGTTMAKLVAENVKENPSLFEETVQMWVFEEEYTISKDSPHYSGSDKPEKLSQLINRVHENVKYLPNITLPSNVVANPDLPDSCKDSTMLIFVLPHQFIARSSQQLVGKILPYARAICCTKGVDVSEKGIRLMSETIGMTLNIYCGALSGANIASEIAQEKYSETTVAYDPPPMDSRNPTPSGSPNASQTDLTAHVDLIDPSKKKPSKRSAHLTALPNEYPPLSHENVRRLFHRPYFHVHIVNDVAGVSLGGALKNIIALAAGFVDGLGWGDNAKAAVMRVGILEMVKFGKAFFGDSARTSTFTEESCGVADVITSCSGGRNFRCAKMSVARGKTIYEIEQSELNGQKLQGTSTAYEVNEFLKAEGMEADFPLFTAVYNILEGKNKPEDIPQLIEKKP